MPDIAVPVLARAMHHAAEWLNGLPARSVMATTSLETLRERLSAPLAERGLDPIQVIDELVADTEGGHLGCAGGRFFAWVIGGALPAALAADWLTSAWDQNAAIYASGPAAAVVEEVVGVWLKELLDLPSEASFALTTGGQLAHFTCLAAARHAVLNAADWHLARDGLFGAPPIRVITTSATDRSTVRCGSWDSEHGNSRASRSTQRDASSLNRFAMLWAKTEHPRSSYLTPLI
jgi:Pyridoxal-dependent decarboxylase conserved domain